MERMGITSQYENDDALDGSHISYFLIYYGVFIN